MNQCTLAKESHHKPNHLQAAAEKKAADEKVRYARIDVEHCIITVLIRDLNNCFLSFRPLLPRLRLPHLLPQHPHPLLHHLTQVESVLYQETLPVERNCKQRLSVLKLWTSLRWVVCEMKYNRRRMNLI